MKSIKENVIRLKWNSNKIGDALENHFLISELNLIRDTIMTYPLLFW